jgi:hypothetical protein
VNRPHVNGHGGGVCVPSRTVTVDVLQLAEILAAAITAGSEQVVLWPPEPDGTVHYAVA